MMQTNATACQRWASRRHLQSDRDLSIAGMYVQYRNERSYHRQPVSRNDVHVCGWQYVTHVIRQQVMNLQGPIGRPKIIVFFQSKNYHFLLKNLHLCIYE